MMKHATGLFLLLLLFAIAAPAWARLGGDGAGLTRSTLHHDGGERGYYVHVPARVAKAGQRMPLVINLHGGGGNGRIAAAMTGFTATAEREGFIVVHPDGSGGREDKLLTWNVVHCCAYAMRNRTDDVGFIRLLIDKLVQELPVDPLRVYATGMSNGGMMAHRLGIAMPDRIAAIASVVGGLFGDEPRPAAPVPALIINGALDKLVKVEGGELGGRVSRASDAALKPAAYQGEFWARANGCSLAAREERPTPQLATWRHACPPGQEVVRYLVLDGGHAWPKGASGSRRADTPSASLETTDVIWDFFKSKSKRSR